MQKNQQKYRSGDRVPMSCNYKCYDKYGENDGEKTYLEKGTKFPPTQHEGAYWVMDMTKEKNGRDYN